MIDTSGASLVRDDAGEADLELELSNRCFVYALLSRAFAKEPDEELLLLLASDHARAVFGMYEQRCSWAGEAGRALDGLLEGGPTPSAALADGAVESLSRLRADYTYLFLGPGRLPAALWESVYVTGRNEVCTEETLAVRNAYRDSGFSSDAFPFVADDHIAVELAFVASLAKSALDALGRVEGAETFERAVAAHDRFLDEHLNRWAPLFAGDMLSQAKTGPLYPALAAFAAQFCHNVRKEHAALFRDAPRPSQRWVSGNFAG